MREAASPSFFNPAEAVVVLDYIKQLVKEGVQPRNIGVITPYRYYWMDHFDVLLNGDWKNVHQSGDK